MNGPVQLASAFALTMSLIGCSDEPKCDPTVPGTICTIVGNGERGFSDDTQLATESRIDVPQDMAVAPDGSMWFLDFNSYLVRTLDKDGKLVTKIGSGLLGDSPSPEDLAANVTQVPAATAFFNHTTDLVFHNGYLYLAAWHNSRVKRLNLETMLLENYAGAGKRTYYVGDDGPKAMATLDLPSSVTFDPEGNLVIMDQANQVIRRVNPDDTISRIAGKCVVDEVPCAPGEQPVQCPAPVIAGLPSAPSNKFACGGLGECEKPCTPSYGGDGGSCMEARMAQPFGQAADPSGRITYDANGNLIFADTGNNRIRRVTPGGIIENIAGTGEEGYGGDDGPATAAKLNHPVDVEIGPDGAIYFTDVYNSCIRKIDASGTISRVVGMCHPDSKDWGFGGDGGDPLDALMNRPYGIEFSLDGKKMYIADSYNHRIRVVNL